MISVALFNNKGGVGKTTLVFHLAHMLQRMGQRVLAVDLDPQANLTSAFLDEDELATLWGEQDNLATELGTQPRLPLRVSGSAATLADAVTPILEGLGDIRHIDPTTIVDGLWLLPGDLNLSLFEDKLSGAWPSSFTGEDPAAVRTTTAFHRLIQHAAQQVDADLVLIDVGPNLGAINRAALLAANAVVTPLAADLFSLRGLHNLGPTLRKWREIWQETVFPRIPGRIEAPAGEMRALGYVIVQPSVRLDRPVQAFEKWLERIPQVYARAVLGLESWRKNDRSYEIATIRNYRSLMPLAHDARKPMFDLRAGDGALGSTQKYVQVCYQEFRHLAEEVLERLKREFGGYVPE